MTTIPELQKVLEAHHPFDQSHSWVIKESHISFEWDEISTFKLTFIINKDNTITEICDDDLSIHSDLDALDKSLTELFNC